MGWGLPMTNNVFFAQLTEHNLALTVYKICPGPKKESTQWIQKVPFKMQAIITQLSPNHSEDFSEGQKA